MPKGFFVEIMKKVLFQASSAVFLGRTGRAGHGQFAALLRRTAARTAASAAASAGKCLAHASEKIDGRRAYDESYQKVLHTCSP